MKNTYSNRSCQECGALLGPRYFEIHKRTERISADSEVITVLSAEDIAHTCNNEACSRTVEDSFASGLNPVYQPLAPVGTCSKCRKPVDRLKPYVALVAMHVEDRSKPWTEMLGVLSDDEIAIFCPDCQKPEKATWLEESAPEEQSSPVCVTQGAKLVTEVTSSCVAREGAR